MASAAVVRLYSCTVRSYGHKIPFRPPLPPSRSAPRSRPFTSSRRRHLLAAPINLPRWLEANKHKLQPPINNACVYDGGGGGMPGTDADDRGVTVMIVGGPNARTDYHINETPEWFYQYRGGMLLRVVEEQQQHGRAGHGSEGGRESRDSVFRDIPIREGEMFLLPANTPHNPIRFANTVGIVLEQRRPATSTDRLRWYCANCQAVVHEKSFHCTDLGSQIKEAVTAFGQDEWARTCGQCGTVADLVPTGLEMPT